MTPRRVLMTADAVGGVFTYAVDLARELVTRGGEVVLAVLGPAPDADQVRAAENGGASVVTVRAPLDWTARGPGEVERAGAMVASLARAERVDVIHLNHPALAGAASFDRPVVAVAHSCVTTWWRANRVGPLPGDLAWRGALTGRGYHAAKAVIAPSRDFAEATRATHDLGAAPIVVPNGRRPPRFTRRLAAKAPFVITAGRLWDDGKNLVTLDRAAARLSEIPVVAAGPLAGPNGARIELPHLRLPGMLDARALDRLYRSALAFVSAARYEPFGLAVLEAAQRRTPLILADRPVFRELWDGAALFVETEDDAGFADAIRRVVEDEEQRHALAAAAFERARRYSAAAMAAGTLAVHGAALAPQRSREVAA